MQDSCYTAFGLGISSFLPLPELGESLPEKAGMKPEVFIRPGEVPDFSPDLSGNGYRFKTTPCEARLHWDGIGSYLVAGGSSITVDPDPGADERLVCDFLLGQVMAVLLHQRGLFVLHASSVLANGAAVVFLGAPGSGKSTLAAAFQRRGYRLISDDIAAVEAGGKGAKIFPALPRIKLHQDTAVSLGIKWGSLAEIHSRIDKRSYRAGHLFSPEPVPVGAIYLLKQGSPFQIKRLCRRDALLKIMRHSYGATLLQKDRAVLHLNLSAKLARAVPVGLVKAHRSFEAIPELLRLIEKNSLAA